MSNFLLDTNVVIALHDDLHEHYPDATAWAKTNRSNFLYLCPLVENGFLRIFGHPNYRPGHGLSPAIALAQLRHFKAQSNSKFAHDGVSLTDKKLFPNLDGYTSKQLTDIYLLGLAVSHGLRFVTFDRKLPAGAVQGGDAAIEVVS